MYNFTDVSGRSSAHFSSESVYLNGVWLEEEIDQLRILSVSGRESLSAEVNAFSVGSRSGGKFKNRRYKEREITVRYQIITSSAEEFREVYNSLAQILNCEETQVVFADEPDKYFIGTPSDFGSVEPGHNAVIGEFVITCVDPFKYDLEETTVEESNGVITVDYDGTVACHPRIDVEFGGDTSTQGNCGFVSVTDQSGHMIAAGDPEATNASTVIINEDLTQGLSGWLLNSVIDDQPDNYTKQGAVAFDSKGAYPSNWGSSTSGWHGPNIKKSISGSYNFTAYADVDMNVASTDRLSFYMYVTYEDTEGWEGVITGFYINKWSQTSKSADLKMYVGEEIVASGTVEPVGESRCWIRRTGAGLVINVFGKRLNVSYPGIQTGATANVYIGFAKFRSDTLDSKTYCRVKSVCVKSDPEGGPVNGLVFTTKDKLLIDCNSGYLYLNGSFAPEYGNPENEWESFMIEPGTNQIRTAYSGWTTEAYKPTFSLTYRGRYL